MDDKNNYNIEELARITFYKIQLPPHPTKRGKLGISDILRNDAWWRGFDAGTHQKIGRYIKGHFEELRSNCAIPVYYTPIPDASGFYIHDKEFDDEVSHEVVYHYTDVGALVGILKGHMRLSNSLIMNDRKESTYYLDHLYEAALKRVSVKGEQVLNNLKNGYKRLYEVPTYLMSFTENEDDAAQWDRYANVGEGVCIEFDKNALLTIASRRTIQFDYVNYFRDYTNLTDVDILVDYAEKGTFPRKISSVDKLLDYLGCRSALYKHPSFRSENEYRMYYATDMYDRTPKSLKRECTSDGRIREYYEFEWLGLCEKNGLKPNDVIVRVLLGSNARVDKGILLRELAKNGSNWSGKIVDSDCPLRKR